MIKQFVSLCGELQNNHHSAINGIILLATFIDN